MEIPFTPAETIIFQNHDPLVEIRVTEEEGEEITISSNEK